MWLTNLPAPGRPGASRGKRTPEAPSGDSGQRHLGPLACRCPAEPAGRSPLQPITERWTKPAGPPCPSFCQPREGLPPRAPARPAVARGASRGSGQIALPATIPSRVQ